MAKKKKSVPSKRKKPRKPAVFDLIEALDRETAQRVLWALAVEDKSIAARIERLVTERSRKIDIEEVAEEVFGVLDSIDVQELWSRSGKQRGRYVDPGEAAYEMFEEALEPSKTDEHLTYYSCVLHCNTEVKNERHHNDTNTQKTEKLSKIHQPQGKGPCQRYCEGITDTVPCRP